MTHDAHSMPDIGKLENVQRSQAASWRDYTALARLDHVTKHVFIVPGILFALALRDPLLQGLVANLLAGFASAISIASGNYVINEWLDRDFDSFHPLKSKRTAVQKKLLPILVYCEYLIFIAVGLALATLVGKLFLLTVTAFVISGVVYNVRPARTKDRAYLDVVSESINNPIRLVLGWTMVDTLTLPPSSILLAYWAAGAFLMTAKRLSEYRDISSNQGLDVLVKYRMSFKWYTEESLTVSCFVYAVLSAFFTAVFLVKYRIEYIIAFPPLAALFGVYLWLSFRPQSVAQRPERLFRSRRLMCSLFAVCVAMLIATFVDMPFMELLSVPHYVSLDGLED